MAAGSVHIPWYATAFRADKMEAALAEIAPLALRFGATSYSVFRYRDDRYKFLQTATFHDKRDWDRYWHSDDFIRWRAVNQSYFQVPVVYGWTDVVAEGHGPKANDNGAGDASHQAGAVGDSI